MINVKFFNNKLIVFYLKKKKYIYVYKLWSSSLNKMDGPKYGFCLKKIIGCWWAVAGRGIQVQVVLHVQSGTCKPSL